GIKEGEKEADDRWNFPGDGGRAPRLGRRGDGGRPRGRGGGVASLPPGRCRPRRKVGGAGRCDPRALRRDRLRTNPATLRPGQARAWRTLLARSCCRGGDRGFFRRRRRRLGGAWGIGGGAHPPRHGSPPSAPWPPRPPWLGV